MGGRSHECERCGRGGFNDPDGECTCLPDIPEEAVEAAMKFGLFRRSEAEGLVEAVAPAIEAEVRERLRSDELVERVAGEIDVYAPDEKWMRRRLVREVLDAVLEEAD